MEQRRVWIIEEIPGFDGRLGHKQTMGLINVEADAWEWVRPDDQLTAAQLVEWDRVMNSFTVEQRPFICFAAVLEHCKKVS